MKTIIFVLLKIAEILGAALAYGLLCWGGKYLNYLMGDAGWHVLNPLHFLLAIMALACAYVCIWIPFFIIKYAVPEWLDINWEWAESITDKIKRK